MCARTRCSVRSTQHAHRFNPPTTSRVLVGLVVFLVQTSNPTAGVASLSSSFQRDYGLRTHLRNKEVWFHYSLHTRRSVQFGPPRRMSAARKAHGDAEPSAKRTRGDVLLWRFTKCTNRLCSTQTYLREPRTDFKWGPGEGPPLGYRCHRLSDTTLRKYRKVFAEIPEDKWWAPKNYLDKGGIHRRSRRRVPMAACVLVVVWFSITPVLWFGSPLRAPHLINHIPSSVSVRRPSLAGALSDGNDGIRPA